MGLPKNNFHPTVPLPDMVLLRLLKPTVPSTSSVYPSVIIPHDIEPVIHGKKITYISMWAMSQEPCWVEDTTDKVNNNFKPLFNAMGGLRGHFSVNVGMNVITFLCWAVAKEYSKPIFGHSYV